MNLLHLSELAWRNLVHDKVRLAVTLIGIVFAVVLIVVELGLFLGFLTTTSGLIDRSGADLWITASRVPYIEQGVPFSERKLFTVLSTPGVAVVLEQFAATVSGVASRDALEVERGSSRHANACHSPGRRGDPAEWSLCQKRCR
jgi:hypothetical protein